MSCITASDIQQVALIVFACIGFFGVVIGGFYLAVSRDDQ